MESKHWKTLATVLGVVVATGSVTMGLGATVFVTRAEYTTKERTDAVISTLTTEAMKGMKTQLASQQESFDHLREKIAELQTDLAILGERKYLKTTK